MHRIQINFIAGGVDYNSGPYNITFSAGMTTSSLAIMINDDNVFEDNEDFSLTIDSVSNNITIGDPREATVTIVDNESNSHNYNLFIL